MARESADAAALRWDELHALQTEYAEFLPFLYDVFALMGWQTAEVQDDIAEFVAYGPHYLMVQAQRGQAKTTIVAAFAVWCLIHDPSFRVLVVSAGGSTAGEISTLIVRIIMNMEVLECMRPDASNGDKTSTEHFDVHYTLKGIDKSASVASIGITGNLQGKRADLLIADDVESQKNGMTATMRAQIIERMNDFASICESGRIVFLGTPQTRDSVYNGLTSRGFTVRIYPGRFPTQAQLQIYGDNLAPWVRQKLADNPSLSTGGGLLGDQGQPVDPRLGEEILQTKERFQGTSFFQLQHMLNTALLDAGRYPLKPENLISLHIQGDRFPMLVQRHPQLTKQWSVHGHSFTMGTMLDAGAENYAPLTSKVMTIDPAGGGANGDETGYAVLGFLNGNVFLLDVGGVPGGYEEEPMQTLAEVARKHAVHEVIIEKNMGYGAFAAVFTPVLRAVYKGCKITEDYVTGQKERRIQATLEPVMGRGSLVIAEHLVAQDEATTDRYGPEKRLTYSFFFQLSRLTLAANCLRHDDRLDAVEAAVRKFVQQMAQDQKEHMKAAQDAEWRRWMADPLQHNRYRNPARSTGSMIDNYLR